MNDLVDGRAPIHKSRHREINNFLDIEISKLSFLIALFFIPNFILSQICSPHPQGMILSDSGVISDCGRICHPIDSDTICINNSVIFESIGSSCGPINPACTKEYMILAYDAHGTRHRTVWQLSPQVPFTFQITGRWWLRICIRDAHTKKGLCETSFTKIQVLAPIGSIQGPSLICSKASGIYEVSNPQVSETYQWNFGTNAIPSSATGSGPHHVEFIIEGANTITLSTKVTSLCIATTTIQTYIDRPEVFIGNDRTECLHDTVQICVISPRTTGLYLWSTGETTTCIKKHIRSGINQFSIEYISEKGCTVSDDLTIYSDTCSKVGNYVWLDEGSTTISANGIQDVNENGIPNIFVELKNKFHTTIKSTSTDQQGYYEFCTFPGEYYIKFHTPNNKYPTTSFSGNDPAFDSNVNGANGEGTTPIFTLNDKDTNLTIDYGLINAGVLPIKDLNFNVSPVSHKSGELNWSYTNPSEVTHLQIIEKVENEETHNNNIDFYSNEITNKLIFPSAFENDIRLYQIILHLSTDEILVSHQISVDYSNFNLEKIQVSPNPTSDILSIQGVTSKSTEFTILGMDGREYQHGFLQRTDYGYNLDCRNLSFGVYLLKIDGVFRKFTKI